MSNPLPEVFEGSDGKAHRRSIPFSYPFFLPSPVLLYVGRPKTCCKKRKGMSEEKDMGEEEEETNNVLLLLPCPMRRRRRQTT